MSKHSYEAPEYKKLRDEEFSIERILGVVSCLDFQKLRKPCLGVKVQLLLVIWELENLSYLLQLQKEW